MHPWIAGLLVIVAGAGLGAGLATWKNGCGPELEATSARSSALSELVAAHKALDEMSVRTAAMTKRNEELIAETDRMIDSVADLKIRLARLQSPSVAAAESEREPTRLPGGPRALRDGEAGWATCWSLIIAEDGGLYFNTHSGAHGGPYGTVQLRYWHESDGWVVDVSRCMATEYEWYRSPYDAAEIAAMESRQFEPIVRLVGTGLSLPAWSYVEAP